MENPSAGTNHSHGPGHPPLRASPRRANQHPRARGWSLSVADQEPSCATRPAHTNLAHHFPSHTFPKDRPTHQLSMITETLSVMRRQSFHDQGNPNRPQRPRVPTAQTVPRPQPQTAHLRQDSAEGESRSPGLTGSASNWPTGSGTGSHPQGLSSRHPRGRPVRMGSDSFAATIVARRNETIEPAEVTVSYCLGRRVPGRLPAQAGQASSSRRPPTNPGYR